LPLELLLFWFGLEYLHKHIYQLWLVIDFWPLFRFLNPMSSAVGQELWFSSWSGLMGSAVGQGLWVQQLVKGFEFSSWSRAMSSAVGQDLRARGRMVVIYNYLCNQSLWLLMLRLQIPLIARCTRCNIMW
jgi:hypothetical protein